MVATGHLATHRRGERVTRCTPDGNVYSKRWGKVIEYIVANSDASSRIVAFLHAAKTGGSSIGHAFNSTPAWCFNRMKESYIEGDICLCGDPSCRHFTRSLLMERRGADTSCGRNYFLHFAHERYRAVRWCVEALRCGGRQIEASYMTHRSARDRLVSMFCDYWKMATVLEVANERDRSHRAHVHARYRADSKCYVNSAGGIDGCAWFRSVAEHGTGMPFFLCEMFDGSVTNFRVALAKGELSLVRIHEIDDWVNQMTGVRPTTRRRVSRDNRPRAVSAALEDAKVLIDELAERDWEYDQAADEYFMMRDCGQPFVP